MSSDLPSFQNPPVVEVVFGVTFAEPEGLRTALIGTYWSRIEKRFPTVSDHPPINRVIESFAGPGSVEVSILPIPPLRRCAFKSPSGDRLIQVQGDRFQFHVKRELGDRYPRFSETKEEFLDAFEGLKEHLQAGGVSLNPIQYDLSYINMVVGDLGELDAVGEVLRDVSWNSNERRLLASPPKSFRWVAAFDMPNQSGRLHVQAASGKLKKDGKDAPALQLQLTARGFGQNQQDWFDQGHEWIVAGFADLTTKRAHTIWERER